MTTTPTDAAAVYADLVARLRDAAEHPDTAIYRDAELLAEAASALEPLAEPAKPKAKREKSTAELVGAARRMLRAVVERIERDGDVTAWAELSRFADTEVPGFVDAGAGHLLDTWRYSTQQLADERGCSKNNIHKRWGHHIKARDYNRRGLRWRPDTTE